MIENLTFTGKISEELLSDIKNDSMKGLLWNLIDSIPTNISVWESGKVLYANPAFYKCLDIPDGDIIELTRLIESDDYFIVHPDDFDDSPESTNALKNELSSGIVFHKELRMKSRINKEYRWYNTYIVKGTDSKSKVIIEIDEDIHEKKTAAEQLKEALKEKNDLLNEKDLLLKEVHHRVKNNFQVISSLLKLQSVSTGDKNAKMILDESRSRILSMSKIHERLYKSENLQYINIRENISDIVNGLVELYNGRARLVTFDIECDNIQLTIDKAIPCTLILNEVITNSLKYAFKDYTDPKITIRINADAENIRLIVKDNGIGFPAGHDVNRSSSLGLLIVKTFARQISGDIELNNNNGAEFILTFPV